MIEIRKVGHMKKTLESEKPCSMGIFPRGGGV